MNRFLDLNVKSGFPVLAEDPTCLSGETATLSQVSDIFLVPSGVAPPSNWTDYAEWISFIDNTAASGSRHLVGIGGVGEAQESISTLPRLRRKRVGYRLYTLSLEIIDLTDKNYDLARRFQSGRLGFTFWYRTLGGRIFGGPEGIQPHFITARTPLDADPSSIEKASFVVEYLADSAPLRGDVTRSTGAGSSDVAPRVWASDNGDIWASDTDQLWSFDTT